VLRKKGADQSDDGAHAAVAQAAERAAAEKTADHGTPGYEDSEGHAVHVVSLTRSARAGKMQ